MRKNSMKVGIIVAILVLAVGFAAITTTLVITGTIKIAPDKENFKNNVVFNEASITYSDSTTGSVTISDDGKELTYTTKTFKNIGDKAILTYTVKNASQYGAQFPTLSCSVSRQDIEINGTYLKITPGTELNGKVLNKGKISVPGTVEVEMIQSYAGASGVGNSDPEEKEIVYVCKFEDINAVEATATGSDTIDASDIPTSTSSSSANS